VSVSGADPSRPGAAAGRAGRSSRPASGSGRQRRRGACRRRRHCSGPTGSCLHGEATGPSDRRSASLGAIGSSAVFFWDGSRPAETQLAEAGMLERPCGRCEDEDARRRRHVLHTLTGSVDFVEFSIQSLSAHVIFSSIMFGHTGH
ncbi:unnamed protein product, partial [Prorocentrum cordatum]